MSQYYYAKKGVHLSWEKGFKEDLHYFNLGIFAMRQKGLKTNKMSIAPAIPLGVMPRWAHIVSFHQGSRLKSDWKLAHFYKRTNSVDQKFKLSAACRCNKVTYNRTKIISVQCHCSLRPKPCCKRKAKTTVLWLWSRAIIGTLLL